MHFVVTFLNPIYYVGIMHIMLDSFNNLLIMLKSIIMLA